MKISIDDLKTERQWRSATGLTKEKFSVLLSFPPEQEWFRNFIVRLDLGFIGFEEVYTCKEAFLPQKKKKDQDLTAEHKEANRKKAQERIYVEHGIGGMKRYRILVDRLRTKNLNFMMIVWRCIIFLSPSWKKTSLLKGCFDYAEWVKAKRYLPGYTHAR